MKRNASGAAGLDATGTGAAAHGGVPYLLQLYIAGTTSQSARAVANIRKICEEHLKGHYELDVVDISQHPALAQGEQIIAAPTLIKKFPLPMRRFIGDMSQTARILHGLDLREETVKASPARRP
jgi:circadian clock protein KaiB